MKYKVCKLSEGSSHIALERHRQIEKEGYSLEHDDKWVNGELLYAAVSYLESVINSDSKNIGEIPDILCVSLKEGGNTSGDTWPWEEEYDKREAHDNLRKLEIAGAWIAAEIDRLRRLKNNENITPT